MTAAGRPVDVWRCTRAQSTATSTCLPGKAEGNAMAINGVHLLFFSPEAEALRATLRDAFGWPHVDAGGGWLIVAAPPADMGAHPADKPGHEISLTCDDLDGTIADLRARGVTLRGQPED